MPSFPPWPVFLLLALAGFGIGVFAGILGRGRSAHVARPDPGAPFADWNRYVRHLVRRARASARMAAAEDPRACDLALSEAREVLGAHPLRDDLRRLADRLEAVLAPPGPPGEHGPSNKA